MTTTNDHGSMDARSARLYHRYALAMDEGDLAVARAIATDDVRITLGDGPTRRGIEVFLEVFRQHQARQLPLSKHMVTNVLTERLGNEIVTHASFQAGFFEDAGTRMIFGVYDDVHVEVGGELKIAHKKIRVERVLRLPAATPWRSPEE